MREEDILEVLLELATEAGMRVRTGGRAPGDDDAPPLTSGVCRVRGELWVILSNREPVGAQIRVLAAAIRTHAAALIEERHLPPAVRALLEA